MDYLIDQIPFIDRLDEDSRKAVGDRAVQLFRLADWTCGTRDLREMAMDHTSFLIGECVFLFLGLVTLVHAWRSGGRHLFLWLGIVLHGLNVEAIAYLLPDVDNFWHAQSILMFFGRRLPVYVMLGLYPTFLYTASLAARRLRLPWWAEAPATGLLAVLMDLPYDVMGVKLLWWSWHDTDPNVEERMYHVPWTSYYFHASFACSFVLLHKLALRLFVKEEYDWKCFVREFAVVVVPALGSFWLGALQFIPVYHLFHDGLKVPTEGCVLAFLAFYACIVWSADRRPSKAARPTAWRPWFDELALVVSLHYLFFSALVLFADDPASIRSVGLHEPIGPCDKSVPLQTVSGMVLSKKAFLCVSRYDEPYFDFHCLPERKPPRLDPKAKEPIEWYMICGTAYPNHAEYIAVVWALCAFGAFVFYQALGNSGDEPSIPFKVYRTRKSKRE